MSRRVKLPGADELFGGGSDPEAVRREHLVAMPDRESVDDLVDGVEGGGDARGPSGRIRHDEKITVYVTAGELLAIERTRLTLRGEHGLAVDRGRIVREAIHLAMDGVERDGADSVLVQRLRES